jgi:hypothetical protein
MCPAFTQADAKPEEEQNVEVVGSGNLKDYLQENHVVRGSFSINGVEYRDFEAHSPGEVVRKLNEKSHQTGVTASYDDQFRLVLESDSPQDIVFASGYQADQARARAARRQDRSRAAADDRRYDRRDDRRRDERGERDENYDSEEHSPLAVFGIEPSEGAELSGPDAADWAPGASEEDRRKRQEENRSKVIPYRSPLGGATAAEDSRIGERQGFDGGGTTTLNQGPSDVVSPDPHNPGGPANIEKGGQTYEQQGGATPSTGPSEGNQASPASMGNAPAVQPQPGTTPATKENPSL